MQEQHRKIWLEHYGCIPDGWYIHHVDGDRSNNNILNLECVTPAQHGARHREMEKPVSEHAERIAEKTRQLLSANIRFWMLKQNMSIKTLVEKSGIKQSAIYRIKAGDLGATTNSIAKLAHAFGIQPFMMLVPVAIDNGEDE